MRIRDRLTIGNDIVDLRTLEPPLHPRYIERVFTSKEQQYIGTSIEELWAHWAAKEAAYKALKRLDPRVPFIPHKFEFYREHSIVTHGKYELYTQCRLEPDYVHVSCANHEIFRNGNFQEWIGETTDTLLEDPSVSVRKLAVHKLALHYQIPEKEILIYKQKASPIPRIRIRGAHFVPVLSLTHHGRFVACCFGHYIVTKRE